MRLYLQKPVMILTVRENQLYEALVELKNNKSNTIVTMINSLDSYNKWENIVGKGRILPAFPGAGGSINEYFLLCTIPFLTIMLAVTSGAFIAC